MLQLPGPARACAGDGAAIEVAPEHGDTMMRKHGQTRQSPQAPSHKKRVLKPGQCQPLSTKVDVTENVPSQTAAAEKQKSAPVDTVSKSKKAVLLSLLQRPEGATVPQLADRLGWLPHTVRASLTGLRKAGFVVVRQAGTDGGASIYSVVC